MGLANDPPTGLDASLGALFEPPRRVATTIATKPSTTARAHTTAKSIHPGPELEVLLLTCAAAPELAPAIVVVAADVVA
jgi:hypothetical protein